MPVEVEGDATRRVAHLRLEVLRVRTGGHHERGVGVSEVVEANRTDSASSDGRREDPEVVVVEDVPAWRREHESERWQRHMIARRWTYPHRRPGRPPIRRELQQLVLGLPRENSSWGYLRSVGELRKLNVTVSATSVRNILVSARTRHRCRSQQIAADTKRTHQKQTRDLAAD